MTDKTSIVTIVWEHKTKRSVCKVQHESIFNNTKNSKQKSIRNDSYSKTAFLTKHVIIIGNMASVCDVVFMRLFCILCGSNPLRFDANVLIIFLWPWRVHSFRFILDSSLSAWTVRVGWCNDFLQGIAEALFISNFVLAWFKTSSLSGSSSRMN